MDFGVRIRPRPCFTPQGLSVLSGIPGESLWKCLEIWGLGLNKSQDWVESRLNKSHGGVIIRLDFGQVPVV